MTSLFRKVQWWLQRRRKETELHDELQFHLAEEINERQADGLSAEEAVRAARRDLGNVTLLREDARTLWTWTPVEQLAQDVRYGLRGMGKHRLFTVLAGLSLALGIGANTAIYSFMEAILLRSLPVADPASLVAVSWRSGPGNSSKRGEFVVQSIDGRTYNEDGGTHRRDLPVSGVRASARSLATGAVQSLRTQGSRTHQRVRQGRGRARTR